MQQDTYRGSASDPLSLNLYTYCHNEPLMYYDPTGHSEKSALDLIGEIITAKEIYEEEQKWRDGLWPVDPRRNFRTKAQKEAASSAETARSSLKSTEAYEDPTLKQAIDSYLEKEYGGTMADVLDLEKTIISYNSLINEKNRIANQKSIPTVEPHSNEGTGNTRVKKEQLQQLYKESGHFQAGKVTDDMVNDLNRVLEKYGITTPEQIQYFIAVCLHESRLALTEAGWCSRDYVKKYCEMYEPGTSRGKDLGNTQKGDGFLFRGAGYIQLTGRSNYQAFANTFSDENISNEIMSKGADYAAENYAWEAAGFFWKTNNINSIISKGNENSQDAMTTFKQVSNAVNRGPGGTYSNSPPGEWAERKPKFEIARKIIK